jgi:hypothetical protein
MQFFDMWCIPLYVNNLLIWCQNHDTHLSHPSISEIDYINSIETTFLE